MTETRCVKVYKDGVLVGEESCREVSDEELYFEQLERESNDAIHRSRANLENWDSLTSAKKREAIKDILICLVSLNRSKF